MAAADLCASPLAGKKMSVNFSALDWVAAGLYFLLIAGIAAWVAMEKERTTSDYFRASRDAGWFLIGASIFASNIGAEHLVSLAGTARDRAWRSGTGNCTRRAERSQRRHHFAVAAAATGRRGKLGAD